MIVGFSGTEHGMTSEQKREFTALLRRFYSIQGANEFHHGMCIGADEEAVHIAGSTGFMIHGHPGHTRDKRHDNWLNLSDVLYPVINNLRRNHKIVDVCEVLLTTPYQDKEVLRDGVWATLRYANRIHRLYYIIRPGGGHYASTSERNWPT